MLKADCHTLVQRCGVSFDTRHPLYLRHETDLATMLPMLAPMVGLALVVFSLWDVVIDIPHAGWTLLVRSGAACVLQLLARLPARCISMQWRMVVLYWLLMATVEACGALLTDGFMLAMPGIVLCVLCAALLTLRIDQFLLLLSLPSLAFLGFALVLLQGRDLYSSLMFYALAVLLAIGVLMVKGAFRLEAFHNEERLLHQSRHDAMTGANNRAYTSELAAREFALAQRYRKPLSVAMIDIDFFKQVNDRYGHDAGDSVIRSLAATCGHCLRVMDHFGRWGGEEFLVILPETDAAAAHDCAERLRNAVESMRVATPAGPLSCTISIGVATLQPGQEDWQALVKQADVGLYLAKSRGRNRTEVAAGAIAPQQSAA